MAGAAADRRDRRLGLPRHAGGVLSRPAARGDADHRRLDRGPLHVRGRRSRPRPRRRHPAPSRCGRFSEGIAPHKAAHGLARVARPMRAIDVHHMGREKVICCWEVDGVLVDPGPQSTEETLLEALGGEQPRALLLTHIHFDHAGATGSLVRRWPDLDVYVHERGAPHLVDPSKLVSSAGRLYGGEEGLKRLWGDVVPVPEGNLHVLSGGRDRAGRRVPRRVHARPRLPPRLLLPRGLGLGVRRRHGRRRGAARRLHAGAHAAAGHRRRGVGARRSTCSRAGSPPASA